MLRLAFVFMVVLSYNNTSKAQTNLASIALKRATSLLNLANEYGQDKSLDGKVRRKYFCKFTRDSLTWSRAALVEAEASHEAFKTLVDFAARSGSDVEQNSTNVSLLTIQNIKSLMAGTKSIVDNCQGDGF